MALAKNNVFKEYEAKLIETEKVNITKVKKTLNRNKETINHMSKISEVFTTKLFSVIGTFLGKKI